jgi:hypothetical protein
MNQRVEFVFCEDSQSEKFRLSFELFPNSLTRRWLTTMLLMRDRPLEHQTIGAMFADEARDRRAIESGLALAESTSGLQNFSVTLPVFATEKDLKPLRERCQKIIEAHPGESGKPASIRTVVGRIIKDIALYESLYAPEHHFQVDLSYSFERRFFLREEEFSLFTPNRHDGWLYLDYAKTGVSPFNAYLQNRSLDLQTKLTPQDSFLANAQILYREDHEYDLDEIASAEKFASRLLPEPEMKKRLALGLIPLGRPTHRHTRGEVLELLSNFVGIVRVELFIGDRRLEPSALKRELARDRRSLRIYHPYGLGLRLSLLGLPIKIPGTFFGWYAYFARTWAERWILMQPIHRLRPKVWDFGFRMTWPVRKIAYFSNYAWTNRARLIRVRIDRVKYFISVVRPYLWKFYFRISWPIRKLNYMTRYAIRKYVLGKPDKEA